MMHLTAFDVARAYTGTHERAGTFDNPQVLAWLALCGLEDVHDEVPWCSAFVNGCVHVFGGRAPRSGSARARSWLRVGTRVPLEKARTGWDVVVLQRGTGAQPGPDVLEAPGHVGFYAGPHPDKAFVWVLGGNQGDKVSTARFPVAQVLAVQRLFSE